MGRQGNWWVGQTYVSLLLVGGAIQGITILCVIVVNGMHFLLFFSLSE
jgi:hypothetical protein